MSYVDGFILAIPKKNSEKYRKMAKACGKIWMEHGALAYVECRADDVKKGKLTSFPQAVKLKPNEEVWFSWVVYKSRAQRDRTNKKIVKDPRLKAMMEMSLMDAKRMIYGGFKPLVEM